MKRSLVFALLLSSFAAAQRVVPANLDYTAVVGFTSPAQQVAFNNTSSGPLFITPSVAGPFVISSDRCLKAINPATHCNVYVTYTPQAIGESVVGILTLDYGAGAVSVPLTGDGVQYLPTSIAPIELPRRGHYHVGQFLELDAKFFAGNKKEGYPIPYGEGINATIVNGSETINTSSGIGKACPYRLCPNPQHGLASIGFTPDQPGNWTVTWNYLGDGFYGPSAAAEMFYIEP